MNISSINPPLSNVQMELMKLFSKDVPEKELTEIKNMIAHYLLERARDEADKVWKEKGYTDEKLKQMLEDD